MSCSKNVFTYDIVMSTRKSKKGEDGMIGKGSKNDKRIVVSFYQHQDRKKRSKGNNLIQQ